METQNSLPTIMSTFAKQAVSTCKDESIIDNVFISKWQSLMCGISQQFRNKNVFSNFEHEAKLDGSNVVYDSWKFSPAFIDKTLPLPSRCALVVPSKFMITLLNKKSQALPYLPLSIFCSKISKMSMEPLPDDRKNSNLKPPELLDSTSAVCTLTPPQTNSRTPISTPVSAALKNFSLLSAELEELLNMLSKEIVENSTDHLIPMNQTMASLESLILAEKTLISLGLCMLDSSKLQIHPNISQLKEMIYQESLKVFPKIISDKKPDLLLALGLLLVDNEAKKGLKMLQKTNATFNFEDAEKIGVVGRLGMRYCATTKLSQYFSSFKNLLVQSAWARKLEVMGGNCKTMFSTKTQDDKFKVLQCLVNRINPESNSLSVMDVIKYSEAQDVNKTSALTLYITSILTSHISDPSTSDNVQSQEEIRSNLNNILTEHVSWAMSSIPDNEKHDIKLKLIFDLFITKVNPYNYEVLLFLLKIWKTVLEQNTEDNHVKQELEYESGQSNIEETYVLNTNIKENFALLTRYEKMLTYLLHYPRIEEPTTEEIDNWHKSHPTTSLPSIARKRLPFHYLSKKTPKEAFKFLMKEFKLKNLDQWLKSAIEEKFVFRVSSNNICIQTAQNEVNDLTADPTNDLMATKSSWMETLNRIEDCLSRITDLSHATSVSHWIINRMPEERGSERLFCARMCRKFAEGWVQQAGSTDAAAQKGFIFAVITQIRLEIEQVLRKNHLLDESNKQIMLEFQKLESSKVVELIQNLYKHSSIVERSQNIINLKPFKKSYQTLNSSSSEKIFPNINDAVKEISSVCNHSQDIFDINLDVIRYELLDSLLKEKAYLNGADLDETVTNFNLNLLPGTNNSNQGKDSNVEVENSNYIRCVYLLQGFENNKGIDYLLQIAMDEDPRIHQVDQDMTTNNFSVANTNTSTMHKLRSLKCLLSVARPDELGKMGCSVFEDKQAIEKRYHNYGFVSRLESLNLPAFDLASFEDLDKTALIEGILRIGSYSSKGKNKCH